MLKNVIFWIGLICLNFSCLPDDDGVRVVDDFQETYELFFSYGTNTDRYLRRHLVDYFQMVVLASEYGADFPLVKKWTKTMKVYMSGSPDPMLEIELKNIVEELNDLFTDGFQIQIVDDSLASNFHIYLGDKSTYSKMYPDVAHLLPDNKGLFTIHLNSDFSIDRGHMFVDIVNYNMDFQKHVLREEITQSLGLTNDIQYYNNSIFYALPSKVQSYSNMDIEVIRLLYHPRIVPKLGTSSVTAILENILGI